MANIYVTLTGTNYYHGTEFLKPGMKVKLVKEPDNQYDKEAILVKLKGLGDIGHVANSYRTVLGECISAGRLYDKVGKTAKAKVMLVSQRGVILKVSKKSLICGPSSAVQMETTGNMVKANVIPEEEEGLRFE